MSTRASATHRAFLVRLRRMEEEQEEAEAELKEEEGKERRVREQLEAERAQQERKEAEWWEMEARNATAERLLKETLREKLDLEKILNNLDSEMEAHRRTLHKIEQCRFQMQETVEKEEKILCEFEKKMDPARKSLSLVGSSPAIELEQIRRRFYDRNENDKVELLNRSMGNLLVQHEHLMNESQALKGTQDLLQDEIEKTREKIRAQAEAHQVIMQHLDAEEQTARESLCKILQEERIVQEDLSILMSSCKVLEDQYCEFSMK